MGAGTRSLAQSALVITIGVGVSRIFGLVREIVIAHQFGTSSQYDAYLIAFLIPSLLRMLLAEGALSAAFIPLFTEYLKKGKELADRFASNILTISLVIFPAIILLAIGLAPFYIPFLADGFNAEKLELTNFLTRITMPFLMMMGIAAVFMGIQNSHERFFAPAFASVFFNIGLILGALVIAPRVDPPSLGLAIGVLIGGTGQLLFQIPFLRGTFRYKPLISLNDEGFRRLLTLMLPVVLGLIVVELNVLVDKKLASRLGDGAISTMDYAVRLFQLPLGLIGVALATAILPRLSRLAEENREAFVSTLQHGLRLALIIMLPAAIGLGVLAEPIIALLLQHGVFTAEDTINTAIVLRFLCIGLIGYGVGFMLTRGFYALQDTRTPVLISAVAVAINIVFNFILIGPLGLGGLALATSIAGLSQMIMLAIALQRKLSQNFISGVADVFVKVLLFAGLMGLAVWFIDGQLLGQNVSVIVRVLSGLVTGGLLYGVLVWVSGLIRELVDLLPFLKRFVRDNESS